MEASGIPEFFFKERRNFPCNLMPCVSSGCMVQINSLHLHTVFQKRLNLFSCIFPCSFSGNDFPLCSKKPEFPAVYFPRLCRATCQGCKSFPFRLKGRKQNCNP